MSLRRFFQRRRWDRERSEEIDSYLQIETDANLARGMPETEARATAQRKFGNSTLIREEIYRMNTLGFLDRFARDVRYALRGLRHNPTFTAVALLTLAIGIGANTAVFSVVNGILLKPLAYPHPEQLVALHQDAPGMAGSNSTDGLMLSGSMYFTYAEQNHSFQAMGVWFPATVAITGLAEPEQVPAAVISDGILPALRISPAIGRWLGPADQKPGAPETVMIGYGYWQRHFGGDRSVIGRGITVEARPREIVGVIPGGFRFPGARVDRDADLIVPIRFDRSQLTLPGFGFIGIARLKPGISIAQANADLRRLVPIWMVSWPYKYGNPRIYETWRITPNLRPLQREVVGDVASVLWVIMATIGVVLLIACANVANLLLVRADARQHELAIRAALGAGRGQIVRELLLESVLLSVFGGVFGVGLAAVALRLLLALNPADLPRIGEISLDGRSLLFTLVLSLLSGLLFGLIPAWKYAGPRIGLALRATGRNASLSRERHHTRSILVVGQVALALILMVSAGLMIRTFQALRTVDPGFTLPSQVQTMQISIPDSLIRDPREVTRIENNISDKLAAIPGVTSVAFANRASMDGLPNWDGIIPEGKTVAPGEIPPMRSFKNVSPGFFHAAGTRLIAGRELTWADVYNQRRFALISENLARELWGSPAAAIGKRFVEVPGTPWWQVIGVVQDVREMGVQEKAPAIVYWPTLSDNVFGPGPLDAVRTPIYLIRSGRAGTESFLNEMRKAVWSVNSAVPVAAVRTMQEIYDRSLARTSFTLVMLAIAGSMALLLGIVGIYGVISYSVCERRREIGIRLALGSEPGTVRRMFVGHGIRLAALGAAIGIVAAAGAMRLMKSLLFGISPLDPLTYAAVAAALAAAAAMASYLPARRAAALDPVETLRAE